MLNGSTPPVSGRVTARLPAAVHETLEYAAALAGATLNQFMVQASLKEAHSLIERSSHIHKIVLSVENHQRLWALIDNPPELNPTLKEAAQRHKEFLRVPR